MNLTLVIYDVLKTEGLICCFISMLSKKDIQKIFKRDDLRILKSLGQNFLINEDVLKRIIRAGDLKENDVVIEIGPGLGVLTVALAEKCAKVVAIEKDRRMAELVKNKTKEIKKIEIINEDILRADMGKIVEKYAFNGKYKLISNIPYYITSKIIKLFLEGFYRPELMVMLVQKEVAERICAEKGRMSVLGLSVQFYADPKIIDFVDKSSFYPKPKVDSAILKIENIKENSFDARISRNAFPLFRLIKIGFAAKRKKLANNLAGGLRISREEAKKLLANAGINSEARAQELDVKDWKRLAEAVGLPLVQL